MLFAPIAPRKQHHDEAPPLFAAWRIVTPQDPYLDVALDGRLGECVEDPLRIAILAAALI